MSTIASEPVTISLVIPSYNRGNLIAETIDSALAQSVPFAEIIVVDDGSRDNTAHVLASYGDKIQVIQLTNGGVQRARNIGVASAAGHYIALCDSDDLLTPQFVEKSTEYLAKYQHTDAIYCNFVTFDASGVQPDKFSLAPSGFFEGATRQGEFLTDVTDLYLRMLDYQPLFMSGCLIKKTFYDALGGFNAAFNNVGAEDWEFTLRVVGTGKVALCTTVLAKIRKHLGNESTDTIRQVIGTATILEHALTAHPFAISHRQEVIANIAYRRGLVFQEAFAQGRFALAEEMLSLLKDKNLDPKFRLKVWILRLPPALRQRIWRLTQQ